MERPRFIRLGTVFTFDRSVLPRQASSERVLVSLLLGKSSMKCILLLSRSVVLLQILTIFACQQKSENSEPHFAHFRPEQAASSPLARLEMLKQGFRTDFSSIRVCVRGTYPTIKDRELVLETKLAYAAWLEAAGANESDWARFDFSVLDDCANAPGFASRILLGTATQDDLKQETFSVFKPATVNCTRSGRSLSCSSTGTTLGVGSPGGLSYSIDNRGRWVRINSFSPAYATMSPYTDWLPLDQDLQANKTLAPDIRAELIASYKDLLDEASFSDLIAFNLRLASTAVLSSGDRSFQKLMEDFSGSTETGLTKEYQRQSGLFHVLLHEVGHQFGMDHADQPGRDSQTGQSGVTTLDPNGRHVTEVSAMAYGLDYFYLTEDDRAGIKSLGEQFRTFLDTKKP